MTTYPWAQLSAGTYGLPGPAVVLSSWVLELRAQPPELFGFRHLSTAEQWPEAGPAHLVVADFPDPWDVLLISAERPDEVDPDGLRAMQPGAANAGEVHWYIGSAFRGATAQAFHDQAHRTGSILVLTGDLRAHWSAAAAVSFAKLFPAGAWAAWVPLLVRPYDDGMSTRPD